MNPKKISLFLLITSIVFSSLQTFSQSDTTVVIREDQEICHGTQPELLTSEVSPVPDKYQWQNATTIMPWTDIDTATREVYQPPELDVTTRYRLIVTYNDKGKYGPRSVTDTSITSILSNQDTKKTLKQLLGSFFLFNPLLHITIYYHYTKSMSMHS